MSSKPTLLLFQLDLRLADQAAVRAAIARRAPVIPVYIWDPKGEGSWAPGAASRWWLHRSLQALDQALRARGSRLTFRSGSRTKVLQALISELDVGALVLTRRYEPAAVAREQELRELGSRSEIPVEILAGSLLFEPEAVKTKSGKPFQVFTPFWKACLANAEMAPPEPTPKTVPAPTEWPRSEALKDWHLEPSIPWDAGLHAVWTPGEAGGQQRLQKFLKGAIADYPSERDRPDHPGTSQLSPYLHFGELSPRQLWHSVQSAAARGRQAGLINGAEVFLREVGWREFAYHLLVHFPHTPEKPLRPAFEKLAWQRDARTLKAWKKGCTGYPLVDAGLRQLWATGWMHNRVRMIVGSFLVKDLLTDWQTGARWFWDTLVDCDLANNTLGWQWVAGCGADAAPYFRVFNPITQGERFDPAGDYVRQWVPEIARLPTDWIHRPWEAPEAILKKAGIILGETYPQPLVDHGMARQRALATFGKLDRAAVPDSSEPPPT